MLPLASFRIPFLKSFSKLPRKPVPIKGRCSLLLSGAFPQQGLWLCPPLFYFHSVTASSLCCTLTSSPHCMRQWEGCQRHVLLYLGKKRSLMTSSESGCWLTHVVFPMFEETLAIIKHWQFWLTSQSTKLGMPIKQSAHLLLHNDLLVFSRKFIKEIPTLEVKKESLDLNKWYSY